MDILPANYTYTIPFDTLKYIPSFVPITNRANNPLLSSSDSCPLNSSIPESTPHNAITTGIGLLYQIYNNILI